MRFLAAFLALLLAATGTLGAPAPARTLGADEIAAEILQRIERRQSVGDARLELDNPGLRVALAAGAEISVEGLSYDARSGRVAAMVGAEGEADSVRVTGRLRHMIEVPVLARMMSPGETVAAQDVARIQIAADRLTQAFVTDAGELIGRTPRRVLRPSEPVRVSDLQVPLLIKRNDLVTVTLQTNTLVLTAQGKALEDGGRGATIRVANTKSGRVLDGVVTGPGLVTATARN